MAYKARDYLVLGLWAGFLALYGYILWEFSDHSMTFFQTPIVLAILIFLCCCTFLNLSAGNVTIIRNLLNKIDDASTGSLKPCPNCGVITPPDMEFCPKCGTRIR